MPDIFQDSSRYFHISAFYALSLPYYHMEHHTHSSYEIMYITSGSCRVFCLDGTQDTEFPLKSGQFIFIRPDVPHRLEIPDGFPCSILNLEFSLTPEKTSGCSGASPEKWIPDFPGSGIYGSLPGLLLRHGFPQLRIQPEGSAHHFYNKIPVRYKRKNFSSFFFSAACLQSLHSAPAPAGAPRESSIWKKALRYIDEHYLEDIDIPAISAYAGINKSYLQALFTEKNGCTINTYINRKRMEQAAFLLCNSTLHITDIAFSSGYNSRQHFAHTFEKFLII